MGERIKITITPSDTGILTVEDAMRQVIDFFQYLSSESNEVVWRFVSATTNSPTTFEAEAVSPDPNVDVQPKARAQKARVAKTFRALLHGHEPRGLRGGEDLKRADQMLHRNTNAIALTQIVLSPSKPPLTIDPAKAQAGITAIEKHQVKSNREHVEIGSIEGRLVKVGSHYGGPAIFVKERKSGREIACRVSRELCNEIANDVNFKDVWEARRVMVRGRLRYDKEGTIYQVDAIHVERIVPHDGISLDDLYDPDFTGGLSSVEYLDDLREG